MASNFLSGAVEYANAGEHNRDMAPRPKKIPKELRRPTFIKAWRRHRGLTLEGMVEALFQRVGYEITDGQLSRIERGESPYTQDTLEAIAAVLQVQSYVLLRSGPPRPDEEEDPEDIVHDMTKDQRRQAAAVLRALKTGTR